MGIIDVHVHLNTKEVNDSRGEYHEALLRYFRKQRVDFTIEQIVAEFDAAGVEKMVILNIDDQTNTGRAPVPNDYMASVVNKYPDRFIGFCGIDPHKGKAAVKELERSIKDLHLTGLKLHPTSQAFYPNDRRFYPLWEKSQELGIPLLFHTGMSAFGQGLPGGGGARLAYSNPIYLDDVAADFPDLRIQAAHPSWPWQEEGLAVALHKPNVYLDLSGWAPKYFPPILIQYANTVLSDKCMYGSDFPALSPKRWLQEFEQLDFKPESRRKILELNARQFLRL